MGDTYLDNNASKRHIIITMIFENKYHSRLFFGALYINGRKAMDQKQHVAYWLDSAQHDLETAENLFLAAKYDWCLFLGHLVLEKALKAAYVLDHENEFPPKTHNLVRLIQSTSIPVDENMLFWLDQVNDFHVEARYPDYKYQFYKTCTFEFAENHFSKIKETFSWIKSHLK